jgi:hypothetical protein
MEHQLLQLLYKTNNKVTPRLQFFKILISINITQKTVCCLSFCFFLGHICSLRLLFKWAIACSRCTKFMLHICTEEHKLHSACLNKYPEKFLKFCDLSLCTVVLACAFFLFGRTSPYPSKLQLLIQEHAESLHETAVSVQTWKKLTAWRWGWGSGGTWRRLNREEAGRTGGQGATQSRQLLGRRRPPLHTYACVAVRGKKTN